MSGAVYDCETDGLLDEVTKVHCIVVKDLTSREVKIFDRDTGNIEQGLDHLQSFDFLVCHNQIGYDLPMLRKLHGWEYQGKVIDSLVLSRSLWPKRPIPKGSKGVRGAHGLAAWGYRVGRGKPEIEDWSEQPLSDYIHRCVEDVEINFSAYRVMKGEMSKGEWANPLRMEHMVTQICEKQAKRGVLLDTDLINHNISIMDIVIDGIKEKIDPLLPLICEPAEDRWPVKDREEKGVYKHVREPFKLDGNPKATVTKYMGEGAGLVAGPFSRVSFRRVNIDSDQEVKDYLLKLGWKPERWNRSKITGEITGPKLSHDDAFIGVRGRSGRLISKREQAKSRRTVLRGLLRDMDAEGIVEARVNAQGAASVRATHRLVVNIPGKAWFGKNIRRCFIARLGYTMIGCDSDANQLRMLAHYMGDDAFTHALINGKKSDGTDMHSVNAKILGCSRSPAKNFKYAFLFGAGDLKLGVLLGGLEPEGKAARAKYLAAYPLLDQLIQRVEREAKQYKHIKGLDGRKVWVPEPRKALNYLLQSAEAIYMKYVMCMCERDLKGYDIHQVIWMHDEMEWEARPEIVEDVKPIILNAFLQSGKNLGITVPMPGDFSHGPTWADVH